jgi:hypothetical protein
VKVNVGRKNENHEKTNHHWGKIGTPPNLSGAVDWAYLISLEVRNSISNEFSTISRVDITLS